MGISLGGARLETIAEVNMVPLIDILLVLLVIFMVIRPQVQVGLPVDLPQQTMTGAPAPVDVIVVQVFADSSLRINQVPVQWQDLHGRLADIFRMRASRVAFVRGDSAVEFGVIARAIDVMRGSGITSVGLMTPQLANAK
ncbi:MAG: biopolymer transporter ExbD [Candidatus Acidiferrum sp.]